MRHCFYFMANSICTSHEMNNDCTNISTGAKHGNEYMYLGPGN